MLASASQSEDLQHQGYFLKMNRICRERERGFVIRAFMLKLCDEGKGGKRRGEVRLTSRGFTATLPSCFDNANDVDDDDDGETIRIQHSCITTYPVGVRYAADLHHFRALTIGDDTSCASYCGWNCMI